MLPGPAAKLRRAITHRAITHAPRRPTDGDARTAHHGGLTRFIFNPGGISEHPFRCATWPRLDKVRSIQSAE